MHGGPDTCEGLAVAEMFMVTAGRTEEEKSKQESAPNVAGIRGILMDNVHLLGLVTAGRTEEGESKQ